MHKSLNIHAFKLLNYRDKHFFICRVFFSGPGFLIVVTVYYCVHCWASHYTLDFGVTQGSSLEGVECYFLLVLLVLM